MEIISISIMFILIGVGLFYKFKYKKEKEIEIKKNHDTEPLDWTPIIPKDWEEANDDKD